MPVTSRSVGVSHVLWTLPIPLRFLQLLGGTFQGSSRYMGVSKNNGTPKSSILIGFSIINHPFWDTPIFGNTHISKSTNPTTGQTMTFGNGHQQLLALRPQCSSVNLRQHTYLASTRSSVGFL